MAGVAGRTPLNGQSDGVEKQVLCSMRGTICLVAMENGNVEVRRSRTRDIESVVGMRMLVRD